MDPLINKSSKRSHHVFLTCSSDKITGEEKSTDGFFLEKATELFSLKASLFANLMKMSPAGKEKVTKQTHRIKGIYNL